MCPKAAIHKLPSLRPSQHTRIRGQSRFAGFRFPALEVEAVKLKQPIGGSNPDVAVRRLRNRVNLVQAIRSPPALMREFGDSFLRIQGERRQGKGEDEKSKVLRV